MADHTSARASAGVAPRSALVDSLAPPTALPFWAVTASSLPRGTIVADDDDAVVKGSKNTWYAVDDLLIIGPRRLRTRVLHGEPNNLRLRTWVGEIWAHRHSPTRVYLAKKDGWRRTGYDRSITDMAISGRLTPSARILRVGTSPRSPQEIVAFHRRATAKGEGPSQEERDAAVSDLKECLVAGQLTADQYNERLTAIEVAERRHDIDNALYGCHHDGVPLRTAGLFNSVEWLHFSGTDSVAGATISGMEVLLLGRVDRDAAALKLANAYATSQLPLDEMKARVTRVLTPGATQDDLRESFRGIDISREPVLLDGMGNSPGFYARPWVRDELWNRVAHVELLLDAAIAGDATAVQALTTPPPPARRPAGDAWSQALSGRPVGPAL